MSERQTRTMDRRGFLRTAAVVAGGAALGALAGCGTSKPGDAAKRAGAADAAPSTAAKGGKVTLTVATAAKGWERVEQALMKEYQKRNPNVDFKFVATDALTSGHSTNIDSIGGLVFQVQAGAEIDLAVIETSRGAGVLYAAGVAEPLDQFGGAKVAEGLHAKEFTQFEGKYYGLPLWLATTAWIYNADLYKAAGLDPDRPPATWDELLEHSKALTKAPNQFGMFVILKNVWKTYPWVVSNGGDYFDRISFPTKATINTPEVQQAYQLIKDMVRKHKYAPGFDIKEPLLSKQCAAFIENAATMMKLRGQDPQTDFRVARVATPRKDSPYFAFTGGSSMVMLKRSKNKEEAWKYMEWLLSEEGQRLRCGMKDLGLPRDATANLPALKSLANDPFWDTDHAAKGVKVALQNTRATVVTPVYTEAYDALATMQEKLLTTDLSVKQATEETNAFIQKLLDEDRKKHPQLYA